MKPLKEKVSITLDGDLIDILKFRAESCDRSLSSYINLLLKKCISEQEHNQTE